MDCSSQIESKRKRNETTQIGPDSIFWAEDPGVAGLDFLFEKGNSEKQTDPKISPFALQTVATALHPFFGAQFGIGKCQLMSLAARLSLVSKSFMFDMGLEVSSETQ